jgi:hypothetical protein
VSVIRDFVQLSKRVFRLPADVHRDYIRVWTREAFRFYTEEVPGEISKLLKTVPADKLKEITPPQFDSDEDCADVVRALHHVAVAIQAHAKVTADASQTINTAIYSVTHGLALLTERVEATRQAVDTINSLKIQSDAARDFKIGLCRQFLEILETGVVGLLTVWAQDIFARTGVKVRLPTVGSKTAADGPELEVTDVQVEEE